MTQSFHQCVLKAEIEELENTERVCLGVYMFFPHPSPKH